MWCVRSWHCGIALKSANVSWCPGIAQLDYMTYLNCSNFIMLYEVWQVWFYFDNMFFFFFSWRELEVINNKESTQLKAQLFRFNSKFLKRKKKEKTTVFLCPKCNNCPLQQRLSVMGESILIYWVSADSKPPALDQSQQLPVSADISPHR